MPAIIALCGEQPRLVRSPNDTRRWPVTGACAFPVAPGVDAAAEPALWPASLSPATVILDTAPTADCGQNAPLGIAGWPIILADRTLSDGRHLVLADRDGRHHLWLRDTDPGASLAYAIIRDSAIETRRRAARRLDRRLAGAPPSPRLGAFAPTAFQRRRLGRLLNILDMLAAADVPSTSYDIARELIYPGLTLRRGIDWKSSSERRRTMRLVAQARRMVNGGYRDLLRGVVRG